MKIKIRQWIIFTESGASAVPYIIDFSDEDVSDYEIAYCIEEQIFKQILSGTHSVVYGLGTMRNKLGDAHGSRKAAVKPSVRHSEFAVNLAGATSMFLYKTFKETK